MRMILQVELGHEEMQTGADVIAALKDSLKREERLKLEPGVGGLLWTKSGETVGGWHTTKHAQGALTVNEANRALVSSDRIPVLALDETASIRQDEDEWWIVSTRMGRTDFCITPALAWSEALGILKGEITPYNSRWEWCDECGAKIPGTETSGVNRHHTPACSLYPGDAVKAGEERTRIGNTPPDEENETRYKNYYVHCRVQWSDEWSCCCNDECPRCGGEIEPYASEDTESGETIMHAVPGFIPERGGFPDNLTNAAELNGWDAAQFKPAAEHHADTDCTVDTVTRLCVTCGVFHGRVACRGCGGAAFHKDDCSVLKALEAAL